MELKVLEVLELFKNYKTNEIIEMFKQNPGLEYENYNDQPLISIFMLYREMDVLNFLIKEHKMDLQKVNSIRLTYDSNAITLLNLFSSGIGKLDQAGQKEYIESGVINLLVNEGGLDINEIDDNNATFLIRQAEEGNHLIVKHILDLGGDMNIETGLKKNTVRSSLDIEMKYTHDSGLKDRLNRVYYVLDRYTAENKAENSNETVSLLKKKHGYNKDRDTHKGPGEI